MRKQASSNAISLGDYPIIRFYRILFASTLAPLVLGGCIFPASVQIASFIADGISLVTTDKTLGDHGLSAVTNRDCAVWRAVNGEDICRDEEPGDSPVMVADAGSDAAIESEDLSPIVAPANRLVDAEDVNLVRTLKIEIASLEPIESPTAQAFFSDLKEAPIASAAPAAKTSPSESPILTPAAVKPEGGTFFVIASFSRLPGATRFARRHTALATQVIAGTTKGKTVYRVATGPIGKSQRPAMRAKLADSGFDDAWTLKLKAPKVVVELAALNSPGAHRFQ
jgi:hypothetical protein